jgi:hypothetical protein
MNPSIQEEEAGRWRGAVAMVAGMPKANLPISALNGVFKSLIDLTCIEAAVV